MRKKREEELEALQSKLSELNAAIEHNEVEIKKSLAAMQQVCSLCDVTPVFHFVKVGNVWNSFIKRKSLFVCLLLFKQVDLVYVRTQFPLAKQTID